MVADEERRMISKRTKDALAAGKAAGKALGGGRGNLPSVSRKAWVVSLATRQAKAQSRAADLVPIITGLRAVGGGLASADGCRIERSRDQCRPRRHFEPRAGAAGAGAECWRLRQLLRGMAPRCGS
jgi:hypothetical protein